MTAVVSSLTIILRLPCYSHKMRIIHASWETESYLFVNGTPENGYKADISHYNGIRQTPQVESILWK